MELEKVLHKKFKRKNFFTSLGIGVAGYFVMKTFPFKLLGNNKLLKKEEKKKVKVNINSLAVSRKKIGGNNAGSR
jgi:hypothetical protein